MKSVITASSPREHDAPAADLPWLDRPILLYGGRKSGTTLLMSLVDGGDEIVVYPHEIKLKRFLERIWSDRRHMVFDYLANVTDPLKLPFRSPQGHEGPSRRAIAWRPSARLPDAGRDQVRIGNLRADEAADLLDLDGYLSRLSALYDTPPPDFGALLKADIAAFAASLARPPARLSRWAIKEVGGDPRRIFGFFKSLYPDGSIVVIVRDPLWVVRSIVTDRRRRGIRVTPAFIGRQLRAARFHLRCYQDLFGSPDLHFVAYEQLVGGQLESEMKRVARALGVGFDEALTRPSTLGVTSVVRTASEKSARVFAPRAHSWREGLTRPEIAAIEGARIALSITSRVDNYEDFVEQITTSREPA